MRRKKLIDKHSGLPVKVRIEDDRGRLVPSIRDKTHSREEDNCCINRCTVRQASGQGGVVQPEPYTHRFHWVSLQARNINNSCISFVDRYIHFLR